MRRVGLFEGRVGDPWSRKERLARFGIKFFCRQSLPLEFVLFELALERPSPATTTKTYHVLGEPRDRFSCVRLFEKARGKRRTNAATFLRAAVLAAACHRPESEGEAFSARLDVVDIRCAP